MMSTLDLLVLLCGGQRCCDLVWWHGDLRCALGCHSNCGLIGHSDVGGGQRFDYGGSFDLAS